MPGLPSSLQKMVKVCMTHRWCMTGISPRHYLGHSDISQVNTLLSSVSLSLTSKPSLINSFNNTADLTFIQFGLFSDIFLRSG